MKIDLTLPGGGKLHLEKEPMPPERFEALCWLAGVLGFFGIVIFGFTSLF